jgi:hypothetical protein
LWLLIFLIVACDAEIPDDHPTKEIPIAGETPPFSSQAAESLHLPLTISESREAGTPQGREIEISVSPETPIPTPDYPVFAGPAIDRQQVGLQIHLHHEDLESILAHLETLNVGWVKVQVSWKLYQPEAQRYDDERLVELDQLISAANLRDIKVLLSVAKAPEWSRPITELDGPPSNYTLFRSFMAFLASRYQDRVAAFELWNEPNLQREWNGRPLSPVEVVDLIAAGAAGARSADAHVLLVSGAPATTGINDGVTAIDDRLFLQQMVAAGLLNHIDAIGAHPYGWANPPDSSAAAPDLSAPSHNNHPSFFFADTMADYRSILDQAAHPNTPIWVTEFGWGTFDGLSAPPPAGVEYMNAVSEWLQAVYTLRAYEMAQSWPWAGPLFLWNLNFAPLLGPEYPESGYSLLRPDSSPRPVYKAMISLLNVTGGP